MKAIAVIFSIVAIALIGSSAYAQSNTTLPTTSFNITTTPTPENLNKLIFNIDKEVAKTTEQKNSELAKLNIEIATIKKEGKKLKEPKAIIGTGDNDGDTLNIAEFKSYRNQVSSLKIERDSCNSKILRIASKYDAQIEELNAYKMVAYEKLTYMDSLKTFSGTSLSPMKAAYAYTMASTANTSSVNSSSTSDGSSIGTSASCTYKGLIANETGINGLVVTISNKCFHRSYHLSNNQTIYDDLAAGKYIVTAYNGSNLLFSETMSVNPANTNNYNGTSVYWFAYTKYTNR